MSVPQGGSLRVSASVSEGTTAKASVAVVRLVHGDPSPLGPGYRDEGTAWAAPAEIALRPQPLDLGSYAEVPSAEALNPRASFTLAVWFQPTLPTGNWQTLVAKWGAGEIGYGLFLLPSTHSGWDCLAAGLSHDGSTAEWCGPAKLEVEIGRWQFVALAYNAETGQAAIHQLKRDEVQTRAATVRSLSAGRVHPSAAPLTFGAIPDPGGGTTHWGHFNGKLGNPILLATVLGAEQIASLADGADPAAFGELLGHWDFAQDVTTTRAVDVSPHENHGTLVNFPARAVTGPNWADSPGRVFTDKPSAYEAVHFHDDDLSDAGWEPSFAIDVPSNARSGLYAARLELERDQLFVPFVVRPRVRQSELALLLPTLTWQAYSSNRNIFTYTNDGVADAAPCIYDVHRDGSIVYYCSRRKPTRTGDPRAVRGDRGTQATAADLYLIDWLEQKGFEYDAYSDEDLHVQGPGLLAGYGCLLLSSHPEYWTWQMQLAARAYVHDGGRVAYLGGNGVYWVTSLAEGHPYVLETRKVMAQDHLLGLSAPGEQQHSTTLELGGLWAQRGFPPRTLVGVETAGYAWGRLPRAGWGYRRCPASRDDGVAWVFAGVEEEVIGDFGLNMGSAAAYEIDAYRDWDRSDGTEAVVLARATLPEFVPTPNPPTAGVAAADMVLVSHPSGGAVFSVGSIAWTGSLSHNGYDNSVSRITENVLCRFLRRGADSTP